MISGANEKPRRDGRGFVHRLSEDWVPTPSTVLALSSPNLVRERTSPAAEIDADAEHETRRSKRRAPWPAAPVGHAAFVTPPADCDKVGSIGGCYHEASRSVDGQGRRDGGQDLFRDALARAALHHRSKRLSAACSMMAYARDRAAEMASLQRGTRCDAGWQRALRSPIPAPRHHVGRIRIQRSPVAVNLQGALTARSASEAQ